MFENLKAFFKGFFGAFKTHSTEYLEFEERELENVFALLLMGAFVGIPSPPTTLVMRLMPHMVREIYIMQQRVVDMDDIFGEIAALFEIT
ncbi:MAG: hypothetical protein H0Z18_00180 [Thermococcus sp.]|uniref:hypothetical protein n=1 Tax=Thermococcus sp. TaxID=35749 RepID=UPI001D294F99|nr:hypothetical protein [Thermococcus sp.]MBO8173651.1 hypothetical protein [Thermococcus sp.]